MLCGAHGKHFLRPPFTLVATILIISILCSAITVYAVAMCLFVCLSVHHKSVFYQSG